MCPCICRYKMVTFTLNRKVCGNINYHQSTWLWNTLGFVGTHVSLRKITFGLWHWASHTFRPFVSTKDNNGSAPNPYSTESPKWQDKSPPFKHRSKIFGLQGPNNCSMGLSNSKGLLEKRWTVGTNDGLVTSRVGNKKIMIRMSINFAVFGETGFIFHATCRREDTTKSLRVHEWNNLWIAWSAKTECQVVFAACHACCVSCVRGRTRIQTSFGMIENSLILQHANVSFTWATGGLPEMLEQCNVYTKVSPAWDVRTEWEKNTWQNDRKLTHPRASQHVGASLRSHGRLLSLVWTSW